jgi:hypothetical protein
MVPGESHELHLPDRFHHDLTTCATEPLVARINGSMTDSEGRMLDVPHELDISEWWNTNAAA